MRDEGCGTGAAAGRWLTLAAEEWSEHPEGLPSPSSEAHLTPGHTKGNTTWTLAVRDGDKTYQAVIIGSPNVNGYRLVDDPTYPMIAQDYERTFRVLKSLKCDRFLGAHGSYFDLETKYASRKSGAANPFIDEKGCAAFVSQKEGEFRAACRRLDSDFVS